MIELPKEYKWIDEEKAPRILLEMRKLYGIKEIAGTGDNPTILDWAKEVGVEREYKHDETAWCGLTMAVAAQRAAYKVVNSPLWALNWAYFGHPVDSAMLGDIIVCKRFNAGGILIGGHVTMYVGEDNSRYYHCLGGNQSDAVSFARIHKGRAYAIARCNWGTAQPIEVRKIILTASGTISAKES